MRLLTFVTILTVFLFIVVIDNGFRQVHARGAETVSDPMSESLKRLNGSRFEASFLDQMIQHHRSGVDMANIVSTHTERPELGVDTAQARVS